MRLFVAVTPPAPAIEDLDAFLEARRDVAGAPRWVDPEQWHVTLGFMGSVAADRLDGLLQGLAAVATRWSPMTLAVAGGGAFPNPYAARVLYAGLTEAPGSERSLADLARTVRHTCSAAGAGPDGARFHPHLTLGRFGRPEEATRWIRVLDTYAGPSFAVAGIDLVESHLGEGRGGRPRHAVVETFPLGGAG